MLVLFGHAADHVKLLPRVDALRDVCFVCRVFKIVDQQFLAVVVDNIAVEKCYVLGPDCSVDGQECAVYFVHKVSRCLAFETTCAECDVWSHKALVEIDEKGSWVVG